MTYPTKNSDVAGSARDLLPGQYDSAVEFKKLCDSLTASVQSTEDAAWQLLTLRFLAVAQGDQLDAIGEHVGLVRQGLTDEWYRLWLYIQVAINSSQGDPERLIDITKRISGGQFVHYLTKWPGVALLYSHVILHWSLVSKVQKAAAGGVRVVQTGCPVADVFVFGADRDAAGVACGSELAYGSGFAETDL